MVYVWLLKMPFITPNSKFDKFLKNEIKLTKEEQEGYELFTSKGCIACHNGVNIGGNLFQQIGIFHIDKKFKKDFGRFNLTKNQEGKYYFKVPTLRNIEKTAPYFHNGEVDSLKEAVRLMGLYQLGVELKDSEIDLIVKFLKTLTAPLPNIKREN